MKNAETEIRTLTKELTTTSGKSKQNTKQKKDLERFKRFLSEFQQTVAPISVNGPMNEDQQRAYCNQAREVRAYLFNKCTKTSEFKNICTTYGLKIDLMGNEIAQNDSEETVVKQEKPKRKKAKNQDAYAKYVLDLAQKQVEDNKKQEIEKKIQDELKGGLLRNGKKYLKDQELVDKQVEEIKDTLPADIIQEDVKKTESPSNVEKFKDIFSNMVKEQIKQVRFNDQVKVISEEIKNEIKDVEDEVSPNKSVIQADEEEEIHPKIKKVKKVIILEVTACKNCKQDNVLMQNFANK